MSLDTYALDATWRPILKDLGVSSANVLRRAGLPEDLLNRPSVVRLNTIDFYRFWESVTDELDDPLFPLRLCKAIRGDSFSPPLFAALCSPNLLVAIKRIAHYKRLVAPLRLIVQDDDSNVTLGLEWISNVLKPPISLVVAELLFFVTLARIGTRESIKPLVISTDKLPTPIEPYEEFLGVKIEKADFHKITFSRSDALLPFLTSNEDLWAVFEPELRMRLVALDQSVTIVQRVKAVLLEALPSSMASMDAVASRLCMSKRTLQRQLEFEGTSYMRILQQTREMLARHYLQKTQISTAEISFLLGFEEPNSFYRAFRAWTGMSPEKSRHSSQSGLHCSDV
jgi:AraC-like DNA-binding protein